MRNIVIFVIKDIKHQLKKKKLEIIIITQVLKKKGIFLYDYLDSVDRFNETSLLEKNVL